MALFVSFRLWASFRYLFGFVSGFLTVWYETAEASPEKPLCSPGSRLVSGIIVALATVSTLRRPFEVLTCSVVSVLIPRRLMSALLSRLVNKSRNNAETDFLLSVISGEVWHHTCSAVGSLSPVFFSIFFHRCIFRAVLDHYFHRAAFAFTRCLMLYGFFWLKGSSGYR